jgi:O-antigen/teichoic acid export membrane protein
VESNVIKAFHWLRSAVLHSRRGVRDVVILMLPQIVTLLTGFVTIILVARGLGRAGLGQYALVLSVAGVALSLSDLGIGQTAIRFASRALAAGDVPAQYAVLRWAFRMRVTLALGVTAIFFLCAPLIAGLWGEPALSDLLRLGLISGIFSALAAVPGVYFQSQKRFDRNAMVAVAQTLITFLGILAIAWFDLWSVEHVLIAMLIGTGVAASVFLLLIPAEAIIPRRHLAWSDLRLRRLFSRPPAGAFQATKEERDADVTTFAAYNLVSSVIVMVIMRADVWLMGAFLDTGSVGVYAAAARLAIPLAILHGAITSALWPRAAARLPLEESITMLRMSFWMGTVVAAAAAVYAIGFPLLAPILFGNEYQGSVLLGQVLSFRYALALLMAPISVMGYSFGMVREYWWINILQLVTSVGIMFALLPVLGPMAAALALIATEILGGILVFTILRNRIRQLRRTEAAS